MIHFKQVKLVSKGLILVGIMILMSCGKTYQTESLGTIDNPEQAFEETQKALDLIATNLNLGMKSVIYLEEFEMAKAKIFIKQ
ncbi:hypothetical protein [Flavobacterium faecale]|uniref:hypothetical protein n=1 Tax=Flavobacterium faecale TaxID=1355330 RepID=UPI003AAB8DE0